MAFVESEMADVVPIPLTQYGERLSVDGSKTKVKSRIKTNNRRELWRRHTLSDIDQK
ncbi:unnamed protein product [Onchocerca flexuosa]|uniref:Transposase n=1 Tax=Onchocerca flexuosa TaxID=387005 RepID=A0A183HV72_9BILA|nr:unnamed protein product [Onchocerca flexuosa]